MSKTKFTEGEWRIEYNNRYNTKEMLSSNGDSLMSDEQYYPWVTSNDYDWFLMSKSPKMYKMIEDFIDLVEPTIETENDFEAEYDAEARKLVVSAKSLLSEARGEK